MPIDALLDPKETNIKGFEMPEPPDLSTIPFVPERDIPDDIVNKLYSNLNDPGYIYTVGKDLKVLFPDREIKYPDSNDLASTSYKVRLQSAAQEMLKGDSRVKYTSFFNQARDAIFTNPSLSEEIVKSQILNLNDRATVDKILNTSEYLTDFLSVDLLNQLANFGQPENELARRLDSWEENLDTSWLLDELRNSGTELNAFVILSRLRLARPNLYEKIKDEFLTKNKWDKAKVHLVNYTHNFGNDRYNSFRSLYLEGAAALTILSAHKAEITEKGINLTMQDPNLLTATTTPTLPEERSF